MASDWRVLNPAYVFCASGDASHGGGTVNLYELFSSVMKLDI